MGQCRLLPVVLSRFEPYKAGGRRFDPVTAHKPIEIRPLRGDDDFDRLHVSIQNDAGPALAGPAG
jgi:hypothetical protein